MLHSNTERSLWLINLPGFEGFFVISILGVIRCNLWGLWELSANLDFVFLAKAQ